MLIMCVKLNETSRDQSERSLVMDLRQRMEEDMGLRMVVMIIS
jgi:hypothetical protein